MIHKIEMDWSLNIGNVISLIVFMLGGIGAWYDVKTDVKLNHKEAEIKFTQVERFMDDQKVFNSHSENQRDQIINEIRTTIKEDNKEIKKDLKDLRDDLYRSHTFPHAPLSKSSAPASK